jgi:hypothetical protein
VPLYIFLLFILPPLLTLGVSVAYFTTAPKATKPLIRALASAHGVTLSVVFGYLDVLLFSNHICKAPLQAVLLPIVLPGILVLVSFETFDGPNAIHLLQFVNLGCIVWALLFWGVIGTIGIGLTCV